MARLTYVLVGAGLASARAAEALRERSDDDIVIVGEEQHAPYERPELSKGFLAGRRPRAELDALPAGWYAEHGVQLRLGVTATHLETAARQVRLSDGSSVGYDRLLLATGSSPNRLGVEGADLDGVHYLRTLEDSVALQQVIERGGPLVVVGGGWVGLEAAAVAREAGLLVTVLEPAPTPLNRVLGDELGQWFCDLHRGRGVDVRCATGVQRLRGNGRVAEVVAADGEAVPAADVLVGIGVGPRTELAVGAHLEVADGVVTDGRLRTSDPVVWAAGDVASVHNAWAGRRLRVEHWANAQDQGAFAGRSLAGAGEEWARPPFFYTDQYDAGMEYWGWADPRTATLVVRGDPASGEFAAAYLVDGAVHAALHVNRWDDGPHLKALVQAKTVVDVAAFADPVEPLPGEQVPRT